MHDNVDKDDDGDDYGGDGDDDDDDDDGWMNIGWWWDDGGIKVGRWSDDGWMMVCISSQPQIENPWRIQVPARNPNQQANSFTSIQGWQCIYTCYMYVCIYIHIHIL